MAFSVCDAEFLRDTVAVSVGVTRYTVVVRRNECDEEGTKLRVATVVAVGDSIRVRVVDVVMENERV